MNCQRRLAVAIAAVLVSPLAFATNGMNMEGYGPIATGMGGASMAYDNGTAAMMNNPATLGLMQKDSSRLDAALGFLGPDVKSSYGPMSAKSKADAFYMPAVGYAKSAGQMTYGVGVFAQGGMGTEYGGETFLAAGSNEKVLSQVSMGRLIAPLAYKVNDQLTVGGSLDYVWANMDLKMALSGGQFNQLLQNNGGSVSGTMKDGLLAYAQSGMINPLNPVNWARFDFADSSDFTGKATGSGFAGKLGLVYAVNSQLSVGFTYHSKTSLGDLKTSGATVTMNANFSDGAGGYVSQTVPVTGEIKVKDFQWPSTYAVGMSFKANDRLMVAADVKRLNWSETMKDFTMAFTADPASAQSGAAQAFGGATLVASMDQKWKDQTIVEVGASYAFTDAFTGRAGINIANNPIPNEYVNPLFPAIIERHYTIGGGYKFSDANQVNASLTYAPEVKVTGTGPLNNGVEITHSQTSWQVMYSHSF